MIMLIVGMVAGFILGGIGTWSICNRLWLKQYENNVAFTARKNRQLMETIQEFGTGGLGG